VRGDGDAREAAEGYNNRKKKLLGLFHNGDDVSETCEMKSGASSRLDGVDSDHSLAPACCPHPTNFFDNCKSRYRQSPVAGFF
jgi:hypothetical protein